MSDVVLRGRGLVRTFADGGGERRVLDGVSVEVAAGEVVLMMGRSGSGKSTLLAALSGLLEPTEGEVEVGGHDLWRADESARERLRREYFGFVFQGYHLFPALTARQQLEVTLRWCQAVPAREARRRSEQMLDLLGLGDRGHLRPAELSGGEKQRVAIGRALIKNPAVCFADEPTSALDKDTGERVAGMLRAAARDRGAAVLVVTHDESLGRYADRVLRLDAGRLAPAAGPRQPDPTGRESRTPPGEP